MVSNSSNLDVVDSSNAKPALDEIVAPPNSIKSRIAVTEGGSVNNDENLSEDLPNTNKSQNSMESLRKKIQEDLNNENLTMYDEQIPASCIPDSVFEQEQHGLSQQFESDTGQSPGIFKVKYVPPKFDNEQNYYSLFWSSYLNNEQMLNEI